MNDVFTGRLAIAKFFDSVLNQTDIEDIRDINIDGTIIPVSIQKSKYTSYTSACAFIGEYTYKFIYKGDKDKPMDDAFLEHISTEKTSEED